MYTLLRLKSMDAISLCLLPPMMADAGPLIALMKKYRDVPMDYADAMLVALSEDIDTDLVFTLDLRGFHAYRKNTRTPFRILLE